MAQASRGSKLLSLGVLLVILVGITLVLPTLVRGSHYNGAHWKIVETHENSAHMKYVDLSGPQWPVSAARVDWAGGTNDNRLDIQRVTAAGDCSHHCVNVQAVYNDPNFDLYCATAGYTAYNPNSQGHFNEETRIRFSKWCNNKNDYFRRAVTCHEMGHALGLDEGTYNTSCMKVGNPPPNNTPADHDFGMLNSVIYGHSP